MSTLRHRIVPKVELILDVRALVYYYGRCVTQALALTAKLWSEAVEDLCWTPDRFLCYSKVDIL